MERGKYKIKNAFDNPRYSKAILLLSQGELSRHELINGGINAPMWDKSKTGLREQLIRKKVIRENGIKKQYNMDYYIFNWKLLRNNLFSLLIKNAKERRKSLLKAIESNKEKKKKIKKRYEKKTRDIRKKHKITGRIFKSKGYEFTNKIKGKDCFIITILNIEINRVIKNLNNLISNLEKFKQDIPTFEINWLKLQLKEFFNRILSVKDGFYSLNDELLKFVEILNKKGPFIISYTGIDEFDMDEVENFKIKDILKEYYEILEFDLEMLAITLPSMHHTIKKKLLELEEREYASLESKNNLVQKGNIFK